MPTPPRLLDRISAELAGRSNLLVWILAIQAILLMPVLIVGTGFLPLDDCLRHAAKAVDGRPWSEILVLRPGLMADPNAAWHGLLRLIHLATGAGPDTLVVVSVVGLTWLVLLAPLPWLAAPEAWLGGWLLLLVSGGSVYRLVLGRPLLVNMAVLLMVMAMWHRTGSGQAPPRRHLAWTTLLIGTGALLHGSWYLLCLIPLGFFLAGHVRNGLRLTACWLAGSTLAGLATGHPVEFLAGQIIHMRHALNNVAMPTEVVPELRPSGGGGLVAILCLGAVVLTLLRDRRPSRLWTDPLFMLALTGWILGLRIARFWGDWGLPCAVLWLAFQAEPLLLEFGRKRPWRRLELAAGIGLTFLLFTSANLGGRWSLPQKAYLTRDRPELTGWLPGPGGIFYSEGMDCFFDTFYRNPGAPWRYMVGFEASMMPPEDLDIFQSIARGGGEPFHALKPWIARMRPEDRLMVRVAWKEGPQIRGLEWRHAGDDIWLGRTRR